MGSGLALLLVLLAPGNRTMAHGGEDHSQPAPAAASAPSAEANLLATSGATEQFELLLKYAPPETGKDAPVRLFLADYATNRAIDSATFTLAFKPDGVTLVQKPVMLSPGIYEAVVRFPRDTIYMLVATVTAGKRTDFLEVRNIYSGEAAEHFLAEHSSSALPPPATTTGLRWWFIAVIAVGAVVIVAFGIRAVSHGSRHRRPVTTSVARDPDLASQARTESVPKNVPDTERPQ
jgi:hypothetical protein